MYLLCDIDGVLIPFPGKDGSPAHPSAIARVVEQSVRFNIADVLVSPWYRSAPLAAPRGLLPDSDEHVQPAVERGIHVVSTEVSGEGRARETDEPV